MKYILLAALMAAPLFAKAQDQMPAATRLAMPGEMHARLDPLIGDWQVEMHVYLAPGAEATSSDTLSATRRWILGGRYVQEILTGTFAGSASELLAIIGHNNVEQRYELATFDTFEPGFMIYDDHADGSTISVEGVSIEAGFGPEPTGRYGDPGFDLEIAEGRSVQRIFVTYPGKGEFLFVEQIFTPQS